MHRHTCSAKTCNHDQATADDYSFCETYAEESRTLQFSNFRACVNNSFGDLDFRRCLDAFLMFVWCIFHRSWVDVLFLVLFLIFGMPWVIRCGSTLLLHWELAIFTILQHWVAQNKHLFFYINGSSLGWSNISINHGTIFISPYIGNFIIPTELIFFRGVARPLLWPHASPQTFHWVTPPRKGPNAWPRWAMNWSRSNGRSWD